jgi:hypothetical protein
MRRIHYAALAFGVMVSATGMIQATLVVPMSLDQMSTRAQRIFVGECTSVRSYWEGTKIWTEARFQVKRGLKGTAATEVRFRQVGGSVSEPVPVEMRVVGAPQFEVGETDLLFLEGAPDGSERVLGLFQGRLRLQRDKATGEWRSESGERLEALIGRVQARLAAAPKP